MQLTLLTSLQLTFWRDAEQLTWERSLVGMARQGMPDGIATLKAPAHHPALDRPRRHDPDLFLRSNPPGAHVPRPQECSIARNEPRIHQTRYFTFPVMILERVVNARLLTPSSAVRDDDGGVMLVRSAD
jgi:hypothetical protein